MPRIRKTVHIDRETGVVTASISNIEDEASLPRRFEELKAAAMETISEEVERVVWSMGVSCDGCGREVEVKEPKLPEGWTTTSEGDFCEACS